MFKPKNIIYFLIFLSLIYCFIGFNFGLNVFDEGLMVYGAQRILNKDIPYKDFFLFYSPGLYWLLAGLFKLFGSSLMVARIFSVLVHCAVSIVVYLIAKKLSSGKIALVSWVLALFWINTYGAVFLMPIALLFSLLGCLFLLNFLSQRNTRYLIICGILSGISLFFRHDIGLFTVIAGGMIIFLFAFYTLLPVSKPLLDRAKIAFKFTAYYLIACGIVLVPVVVYLIIVVPIGDLTYPFVSFLVNKYARFYSLPFPAILPNPAHIFSRVMSVSDYLKQVLLRLAYYFPLTVYLTTLAVIGLQMRKTKSNASIKIWALLLFVLLGILLHIHGYIRGHIAMLRTTFLPAIILFSFLASNFKVFSKRNFVSLIFFVFFLAMASRPVSEKTQIVRGSFSHSFYFDIVRAKGISWDNRGEVYQGLVKYIQANTSKDERIFVGNTRHDRIFCNDIMLYFLSNRDSATKYHQLEPTLVTTKTVQGTIVSEIEKQEVRCIVLWHRDDPQPNQSGRSSGIFLLDDFICKEFTPVEQFGAYTVWKRK